MKKIDYRLVIAVIILSLFGILMIYSSSSIWADYKYGDSYRFLKYQSVFFMIGLFTMFLISKINYKLYIKYSNKVFLTCLFLLILVLIPGVGQVRNGSRSWFGIGSLGIQPSEFMKLSLIIFVSKYLSNNTNEMRSIKRGVLPILFVTILCFGFIMLEPDLGTGVILLISIIGLLFISDAPLSFFIKLALLGLLGLSSLIIAAPYRIKRITAFINPWEDPLGTGFQSIQSMYAIGPGGLFGMGLFNSIQKHFYLPEPQTDFIFSIISEEFGIFGILLVASLFIYIIYRCIKISLNTNDLFGKFLSFGITFQLSFQVLLNLCVVTGLVPVTGVTLPFLSYGGSSLIITMISIGIILNISRNSN